MPPLAVRHQLLMMSLAGVLGAALVGGADQIAMHRLQAQAAEVFAAKDVTADILPPPLYLVEMRMALAMGAEGSLPSATLRNELKRLRAE